MDLDDTRCCLFGRFLDLDAFGIGTVLGALIWTPAMLWGIEDRIAKMTTNPKLAPPPLGKATVWTIGGGLIVSGLLMKLFAYRTIKKEKEKRRRLVPDGAKIVLHD